jgi:hypothetical protein
MEDCRQGKWRILKRTLLKCIVTIIRLRWLSIWGQVVFGVGVVHIFLTGRLCCSHRTYCSTIKFGNPNADL